MQKKVLTIIVTYNFEPWLDKCLQSLLASKYPTDILVIDNASKDETTSLIQSKYPSIKLITNTENLGFGKANNMGLNIALNENYDFAFLVNQDAWIDKDCISILVNAYQPHMGIISPTHFDGTEEKLDTGFEIYIKNAVDKSNFNTATFINAAFWLIPREVLSSVGGFAPIFYHYGEDKDYINRVHFHHYHVVYIPEAKAFHDRQNRIMSRDAFFKREFVYFLTEYCNINYSISKTLLLTFGGIVKKALISLIKFKIKDFSTYCGLFFQILSKSTQVFETRRLNKQKHQPIL